MEIFIGITTFDRPEFLDKSVQSFYASDHIGDCQIHIFDDCSPHWDLAFLEERFPGAKSIRRNERNLGSDENIRQMFLHFLQSGADLMVAVDSDLIFHPSWLTFIRDHIGATDGIMSIYNSACHPVIRENPVGLPHFVEKEHIGSAGAVMKRAVVKDIIGNVPESPYYDWDWSKFLFSRGTRLLVSERSYVQHLGLYGYNNTGKYADYGLGFISGSEMNERWNGQLLEELLAIHVAALKEMEEEKERLEALLFRRSQQEEEYASSNPKNG